MKMKKTLGKKLEKKQLMFLGIIIVAIILIASVAVIMMSNNGSNNSNNNGNGDGTSNGDGTNTGWVGAFESEIKINASHIWNDRGTYNLRVKAKDEYGLESGWSTLGVTMPKNEAINAFLRFQRSHPTFRMFLSYWVSNLNHNINIMINLLNK